MIRKYCHAFHGTHGKDLCEECSELLAYSWERLERCPLADEKPACSKCHIHCYRKDMREKIRAVMRYSGWRMLCSNPVLALLHLMDSAMSKRK